MPSSDYAAVSSGALKLKGSGGVDKKKRKKKPKPTDSSAAVASEDAGDTSASAHRIKDKKNTREDENDSDESKTGNLDRVRKALAEEDRAELSDEMKKEMGGMRGKTEAERRFEELRRKRLDERLKREGVKTHKERVEELNRYLSNLSEHHDMPRIGPG